MDVRLKKLKIDFPNGWTDVSSENPNGPTRWKVVFVAAHKRAVVPVLGGISGSTKTMCMREKAIDIRLKRKE